MAIAAIVLIFLVGLVLCAVGWRSRRVAAGPHCRACEFDLAGVQGRCPECGEQLDAPGAISDGLRKARRRVLAAGLVMVLCAVVAGGAYGYGQSRGFKWNTLKPSWLLSRELSSPDPSTSAAAIEELHSRLISKALSSERTARTLTAALDRQSDATANWTVGWGDFLETCRVRGLMSPEQVQSYARHVAAISYESRPRIAEGENIELRVRVGGGRIGKATGLTMRTRHLDTSETGRVLSKGGGDGSFGLGLGGWGAMGSSVPAPGPVGSHTLQSRWRFDVVDGAKALSLGSWEQTFDLAVDVLPPGTATVEVVEDESIRAAIESSLSVTQCEVGHQSRDQSHVIGGVSKFQRQVTGMVNLRGTPVGLAFDVFWAAPDGSAEWKVGRVSFAAGSGGAGYGLGGSVPATFNLATVDVIFRPSIRVATATTNITKIWGGEIRKRGVPVKLPDAVESEKK